MQRTVGELFYDIAHADVRRGVYRVSLAAMDHMEGFDAIVEMRGSPADGYGGFRFHAARPEDALEGVEKELLAALGRCPACGNFRDEPTK
jgi:hypothetical protein